ncbi:MAG: hypothetical protein V9G14_17765 [Cypionkella sp.]
MARWRAWGCTGRPASAAVAAMRARRDRRSTLTAPAADATARQTGIGAWLPPDGVIASRAGSSSASHVRQGALTVTVLDAEARVPDAAVGRAGVAVALPDAPIATRCACSSRFESGNPRHPAVDVRGEDVAELLPLLEGQRVLLEPALMQLRFGEEPLRPRFDLELVGGDTIIVKASFERASDTPPLLAARRAAGSRAGRAGTSTRRRASRAASTSASRRAAHAPPRCDSPTIGEPMSELGPRHHAGPAQGRARGRRRAARARRRSRDVVDLVPTFRMRAGGSLIEAQRHALRRLRRRGDRRARRRHHPAGAHPAAGARA